MARDSGLDIGCIGIRHHIQQSAGGAKDEQQSGDGANTRHERQQHKRHQQHAGRQIEHSPHAKPAIEIGAAGHGDNGAAARGDQHQAERRLADTQATDDERYLGCPGTIDRAIDKEHHGRRHPEPET
jgi:hypothetical protein